jgi:hypothetical protein
VQGLVVGHAGEQKWAGVNPAPPRKSVVWGGAGFTPAGTPAAASEKRLASCGAAVAD